ncbi:hypothetical protein DL89DRAFT_295384 [Linderina pennispora]|uniref:Uncharacterized protein n=1 Tax=Linderina pennispora TaxID=61395 RepID=A0A1Y1VZ20_9FUNG|nr:uncharacterized protein DL89DRAFT_295384 [Linderina pennispora]ORX66509.1 hypothetical protein DL89DRAFT_295384 [Linderina pennispora]
MHGTDDSDLCADGFDDVLTFFSGISSTTSDGSNHRSVHWPQDKAISAATSPYFQKKRPAVSAQPPMAITLKRSKTGSPPSGVPAWPGQIPVTALPAKFAGKTLLMEIAVARLFGSQSSKSIDKVLYLAPLRALCMERSSEWTKRLVGGGDDFG